MYKDVALSTYICLKKLVWAGHVVSMEQYCIPEKVLGSVLEEEGQWEDHEIDGKMSYRGMQTTCSGFGTGRLQQEIRRSGGRRLGRQWPENWPKRHRRKNDELLSPTGLLFISHMVYEYEEPRRNDIDEGNPKKKPA
jgi:hypothetical protein